MLRPASRLAIAEVVLFGPCLVAALVWFGGRHGLPGLLSSFYIILFAAIRVVGAACQLASERSNGPTLTEVPVILFHVGFVLLLFATISLLQCMYGSPLRIDQNDLRKHTLMLFLQKRYHGIHDVTLSDIPHSLFSIPDIDDPGDH